MDVAVGQEGNLLGIEGAEEGGRHVSVKGACLADGEDELHERLVDVVRCALLGFGPKQVLPVLGCRSDAMQRQCG